MVLENSTLDHFLASIFGCCQHLKKIFIDTDSIDNETSEFLVFSQQLSHKRTNHPPKSFYY